MKNNLSNEDYKDFIEEIKNKIRNSQYEAMKVVNQTLISLYWGIGKEIIKQQLQMSKDKKLKLAFLQTEEGYYPADI